MSNVLSLQVPSEVAAEAAFLIEQEVLQAALSHPATMPTFRAALAPESFAEPLHQIMFKTLCELYDERGTVGPTLLLSRVPSDAVAGLEGGLPRYIGALVANTTGGAAMHPSHYAAELLDHFARRQLQAIGGQLIDMAHGLGDPALAAREAIPDLDAILAARQKTKRTDTNLSGVLSAALTAAYESRDRGGNSDISIGVRTLDQRLGGLWREQVTVIAGRPAMGKSNFANAIMLNVGLAGHGVVNFSKEMGHVAVGQRSAATIISSRHSSLRLSYDELRRGVFSKAQAEAIEHAIGEFERAPIKIDSASRLTMPEIASRCRRYRDEIERMGKTLDVVMIDYIQIVAPTGRYAGNRVQEIAEITGAAQDLAKKLNCSVILLSQLSRQVETREDKRPHMADLRESGSIEQDADNILFLYRDAYYLSQKQGRSLEEEDRLEQLQNVTEVITGKQRYGATGIDRIFTDMATGVIGDLEGRY